MLNSVVNFLIINIPSLKVSFFCLPIFVLWTYGYLRVIGYLKQSQKINPDYARKPFHVLAFFSVFVLQNSYGLPVAFLYIIVTSLIVFYGVVRGEKHPLYQAMVREKDAPYKTYYIVIPYLAALSGGFVSNILFGNMAIIGYLVVGFGDAAGELIGIKWGKHQYVVPSLSSYKTTRSYEGSIAVFVVSSFCTIVALIFLGNMSLSISSLPIVLFTGFVSAFFEGISPHGWDNATMQIAPTWCCFYFLFC